MTVRLPAVLLLAAAECGGATPPPQPPRPPAPMEIERPDDGVAVDTMGMLLPEEVRRTFQGASRALLGCYADGLARVPHSAGSVEFRVRVARDGEVLWAFMPRADLGQHGVQRCMLDVVRGARFPRPRGGETEAVFDIDLAPPDLPAEPIRWSSGDVAAEMAAARPAVDACLAGTTGYSLTLYVGPGGAVLDAGASPPDADSQARADCLAAAATGWRFADPGPAGAKLTLAF